MSNRPDDARPTRAVPVLYVELLEEMLRYRLELPGRGMDEPLQEEFGHRIDRATVRAFQESAEALLRRAETIGFVQEARTRGAVLYRTLLPPRLREPLQALSGPLLVSTSLYGFPWELLHDDQEFWGLRYAIGKRLVMDRPLPGGGVPVRTPPRALVIGSDPCGDLPFVNHEVEAICDTLGDLGDVTCVSGRMATFDAVTAHLHEAFDLVHYCGHVIVDPRAGPALLLAEERHLPAAVIELALAGRPLVFLNGCASARGQAGAPTPEWERAVSSVAYAFLFGGALAVIGTLCDVSDRHAAHLAGSFYRELTAPAPVGEALRRARMACRADPASVQSPTWLSFTLHGNPALFFTAGGAAGLPAAGTREAEPRAVDTGAADRGLRRRAEATSSPRNRIIALLVVLLSVAFAIGYYLQRPAEKPAQLVIGVMEVQVKGGAVPDWMRRFTRDTFNALLSDVGAIRIYSKQKIDFVREKRGLSEIEVAESLGMSKMVSASLSLSGSTLALDLEVVDITTGLLDASVHVQGKRQELIALQNEAVIRVLQALHVPLAPAEREAIVSERTNEELESYRLLMETLGGAGPERQEGAAESKTLPRASWLEPGIAYAQERSPDEAAIQELLARYEAALQAKSLEQLSAMQVEMTAEQRGALMRYFENASNLDIRFSNLDIVVEGDEALATFTREDSFTDTRSGRRVHLKVRISSLIEKRGGQWKVRGPRESS